MLWLLTPETIVVEMTNAYRVKLAEALHLPVANVAITWERGEDGKPRPRADVSLPAPLPPADLDVNDPEAMAAWERDTADLPGLEDFLRAKGVEQPRRVVDLYVQAMLGEIRRRCAAATDQK